MKSRAFAANRYATLIALGFALAAGPTPATRGDDYADFPVAGTEFDFQKWSPADFNNWFADMRKCDNRLVAAGLDADLCVTGKDGQVLLNCRMPALPDDPGLDDPQPVEPLASPAAAASCYHNMAHAYADASGKAFTKVLKELEPALRDRLRARCNLTGRVSSPEALNCIARALVDNARGALSDYQGCASRVPKCSIDLLSRLKDRLDQANLQKQLMSTVNQLQRFLSSTVGTCARLTLGKLQGKDRKLGDIRSCYSGSVPANLAAASRERDAQNDAMMPNPSLDPAKTPYEGKAVFLEDKPVISQIDGLVDRCISQTFACADARYCAPAAGETQKACSQADIAVEALNGNLSPIAEYYNERPSNLRTKDLYVSSLRRAALRNLVSAYGQNFGDYDIMAGAREDIPQAEDETWALTEDQRKAQNQEMHEEYLKCFQSQNSGVSAELSLPATEKLRPDDKAANDVVKGAQYKENMVRAADDIVHNLMVLNYDYAAGSASGCGDCSCGRTPTPLCGCVSQYLDFQTDRLFASGLADAANKAASDPSCKQQCCSGDALATDSCVSWNCNFKTASAAITEKAKGQILKDLREFPELAAGMGDIDRVLSWGSPLGQLPNVRDIFYANHPVRDGAGAATKINPTLPDRGTRPINLGDPLLKRALAKAEKRSRRDFAKAALKFCMSEQDGGPSEEDLLSMPGLVKQALGDPPDPVYQVVQLCSQKAIDRDKTIKTIGMIGGTIGCIGLSIASAGAGALTCGPLFAGLGVKDYLDAAHRSYLMDRCTSTAKSGICAYEDQKKADEEESTARFWAVVGVAGEAFSGAAGVVKAVPELMVAIRGAGPALTVEEMATLDGRLQKIAALKSEIGTNPATAEKELQELQAVAADARKLAAAHEAAEGELAQVARTGSKQQLSRKLMTDFKIDPSLKAEVEELVESAKARQAASGAARLSPEEEARRIEKALSEACAKP